MSLESQKVRQNKERLLAERKRSARLRTSSSLCSLTSQSDLSTSGSCTRFHAESDDLQPQLTSACIPPATMQHPADEACGGSFLLKEGELSQPQTPKAKSMQDMIHNNDTPAPEPPDVAAGGAAKTVPPPPNTWCVMSEYEAQRSTSKKLPISRQTSSGMTWMQDSRLCAICTAEFGPLTRRHHCRRCGRNVCNPCSPYRVHLRVPLAHPYKADRGPCRICVGCHEPC